ncbi:ornithine carbamoyltransferase [Escherichia coli]|nr:ornithine carbamoyltransferase [Escherichia coli]
MENEVVNLHNQIMKHIEDALANEYKYGTNDCNIVALRIVDTIKGTTWASIASYDSLLTGVKQLNDLGFDSTQDIIKQECIQVEIPIDGDIWLDPDNPLIMGIVVSGRLLGVNEEHTGFKLINKKKKGTYYRSNNNG